jgi:hypothetical protein
MVTTIHPFTLLLASLLLTGAYAEVNTVVSYAVSYAWGTDRSPYEAA